MENNLIIASPNKERILSWKQGLNGFASIVKICERLYMLYNHVVQFEPEVLLLDLDLLGLNRLNGVANLKILSPETKIIILCGAISEEIESELLKAGVRGFCRHEISSDLLKQVVTAVQQGELWVRRTITSRLADELGTITSKNKAYRASHDLLNKLTQREYDIALHVANGQSNKQIAQLCAITERTVKAHLSEVFNKLGVADRLDLALIISANDPYQERGESEVKFSN